MSFLLLLRGARNKRFMLSLQYVELSCCWRCCCCCVDFGGGEVLLLLFLLSLYLILMLFWLLLMLFCCYCCSYRGGLECYFYEIEVNVKPPFIWQRFQQQFTPHRNTNLGVIVTTRKPHTISHLLGNYSHAFNN